MGQQHNLLVNAAGIACQASTGCDHTMTRNNDRNRIMPHRPADCL